MRGDVALAVAVDLNPGKPGLPEELGNQIRVGHVEDVLLMEELVEAPAGVDVLDVEDRLATTRLGSEVAEKLDVLLASGSCFPLFDDPLGRVGGMHDLEEQEPARTQSPMEARQDLPRFGDVSAVVERQAKGDKGVVGLPLVQVLEALDPDDAGTQPLFGDSDHFGRDVDSRSGEPGIQGAPQKGAGAAAQVQDPGAGAETAQLVEDELVVEPVVVGRRVQVIPVREGSEQLVFLVHRVVPLSPSAVPLSYESLTMAAYSQDGTRGIGGQESRKAELPAAVERELAPASQWPDAGNWLLYRHLRDALVAPDSPLRLRRTVDAIVERAVLAGARERRSRVSRALFRFHVGRVLAQAVERRRKQAAGQAADLLDVVVAAAGRGAPAAELAEVYRSFVFSVAGSIGFVLGWSVYLLGLNPETDADPAWVVREALRLWPVAWMLSSRPAQPHEVAGVPVAPGDQVVVCPYLIHHHPQHWDEPASFRPERWAGVQRQPAAFIPFGWGAHKCPAGPLSMDLVADVLRIVMERYRLTVTPLEARPCIGPALAPPRFDLRLAHTPERR